jgi:hypothetical protein
MLLGPDPKEKDEAMAGEKNWSCPDRADPLTSAAPSEAARGADSHPYPILESLPAPLTQLLDYWNQLKRGNADIPFADDVALGTIARVGDYAFLVDVFANPLRFRFGVIGAKAKEAYANDLSGRFVGEIERQTPLDFFLSQCAATVEARAPTHYAGFDASGRPYHRLLLPLWADGHIAALLGAIMD